MQALLVLALLFAIYRYIRQKSLSHIRGPKSNSFLLGNTSELVQGEVGEVDSRLRSMFGDVVRIKGPFNQDELWIADPSALQHILKDGLSYVRPPERQVLSTIVNGRGITNVFGETHRQLRKVMSPSMGSRRSVEFAEAAAEVTATLCSTWMDLIDGSVDGRVIIDIYPWASSAALDILGKCGFGVNFGCTERSNVHKLALCYRNMPATVFGSLSTQQLFVLEIIKYIPVSIFMWMFEKSSHPRSLRLRRLRDESISVAQDLIKTKTENVLRGESGDDVLSLLIKAHVNTSETGFRPSQEDLVSNIRTFMLAGHETTATTFSWTLLELARRPHMQSRLREEIRQREAVTQDRSFSLADLDEMGYLNAVVKEALRYHAILPHLHRIAAKDDVVPLSHPLLTNTGQLIHEFLIPAGTRLSLSCHAYNRNRELWGEDADEFNPERWLDGTVKNGLPMGVYANLITFGGGPRGCLGWRLAVVELQTLLAHMINKFEFGLSEKASRIRREWSAIMVPCVQVEREKGAQVPLVVSMASR